MSKNKSTKQEIKRIDLNSLNLERLAELLNKQELPELIVLNGAEYIKKSSIKDVPEIPSEVKKITKKARINYKKTTVTKIQTKGKWLLTRMMYAIYVGDFASYYLALSNKQDPTPVPLIEDFKKRLD